jgi:hypothetical protein
MSEHSKEAKQRHSSEPWTLGCWGKNHIHDKNGTQIVECATDTVGIANAERIVASVNEFQGVDKVEGFIYNLHSAIQQQHSELQKQLQEIESLRAELDALKRANQWISVKDWLPEYGRRVLVLTTEYATVAAHFGEVQGIRKWVSHTYPFLKVTHWRELPEPPKE